MAAHSPLMIKISGSSVIAKIKEARITVLLNIVENLLTR